ncbi:MAG: tail fiber domain-containing protein [Candidatus Aminicenantes bacterium]|jgi:hypothetical protein
MSKATRYLFATLFLTVVIGFLGIANGFARVGEEPEMKLVAEIMVGSSGISWMPKVNYTQLILNISGPDGTIFTKTFDSGAAPYVSLADLMTSESIDGSYTYELCAVTLTGNKVRRDNGITGLSRGTRVQEALTQTGYFTVRDGMIMTAVGVEPENVRSTAQDGLSGAQDQIILDDLIVDGSACIGFDCYNGESFGFDTLRLKENNLRIKFQDTSCTAGFPSNDWQITANDSSNGGANKFSIDDIDSGRTPFTIEAGTRANALYVDDSGRVGLGTSTPAEDLHIWYGDTPTIRLHQSGGGWAPQTWDLAGNEANFFIRDVTNGSRLPFRIKPSAPTSSLHINNNGYIGFGTDSPGYPLQLKTNSSTNAVIVAQKDGGATTKVGSTSNQGQFGTISNHNLKIVTNNTTIVSVNTDGTLDMSDGGGYDGNWNPASSRELKENIESLVTEEAMVALEGLNPVKYNYKRNKQEEHLGFIAEDVPELVAMNGRKSLSTLDIVAVLTKVVQQQQKSIEKQQKIISDLNKRIAQLEKDSK